VGNVGYGHSGPEVKKGVTWTQAQAELALKIDSQTHANELVKILPWVLNLSPVRQDVLFNMAFNLGVSRLMLFKNTLAYIKNGNYNAAASNMLLSKWAGQVKGRAVRLANMMRENNR
jgi:lysozyme